MYYVILKGFASFQVHRPDHWILEGTNFKDDRFGYQDSIVGYECDGCEMEWKDGLPYPPTTTNPRKLHLLATTARWHRRQPLVRPFPKRPSRRRRPRHLHQQWHRRHREPTSPDSVATTLLSSNHHNILKSSLANAAKALPSHRSTSSNPRFHPTQQPALEQLAPPTSCHGSGRLRLGSKVGSGRRNARLPRPRWNKPDDPRRPRPDRMPPHHQDGACTSHHLPRQLPGPRGQGLEDGALITAAPDILFVEKVTATTKPTRPSGPRIVAQLQHRHRFRLGPKTGSTLLTATAVKSAPSKPAKCSISVNTTSINPSTTNTNSSDKPNGRPRLGQLVRCNNSTLALSPQPQTLTKPYVQAPKPPSLSPKFPAPPPSTPSANSKTLQPTRPRQLLHLVYTPAYRDNLLGKITTVPSSSVNLSTT